MTDAHCHVAGGADRHFLCSPMAGGRGPEDVAFYGTHPWFLGEFDPDGLREKLRADPKAGVGEIGLDRLKDRNVSPRMREVFEEQLRIAAEFRRPAVLHGAKCWGEVVKTICRLFPDCRRECADGGAETARPIPAFLFHGFSRSDGLLPDIVALNGYVSVGLALLNDHAVNYRELVRKIPLDRLLVETDRTPENAADVPPLAALVAKIAEVRGMTSEEVEAIAERNATAFCG